MFYWPQIELTDFEKTFVRLYKTDKLPGVLRRVYRVLLNSQADENIPGLEVPRLSGSVQISRRSRVFGLSYAGDTAAWRMTIETAGGERFTGVNPGAPQTPSTFPNANTSSAPIVAAMCPGSFFSYLSAMGGPPALLPNATAGDRQPVINEFRLPHIVEPNWELVPNELLIFNGVPIITGQAILEIAVHVWEFPGMEACQ